MSFPTPQTTDALSFGNLTAKEIYGRLQLMPEENQLPRKFLQTFIDDQPK